MNVAEVFAGQSNLYIAKTAGIIISRYPCMAGLKSASVCARVAALLMLVALVTDIIAVASPHWMEAHNELGSSHSGLFHICLLGRCDEFIYHPLEGWFRMVQSFMILSIFSSTFGHVALALYIFLIALQLYRRRFLMGSLISTSITALLTAVSIIVYGADEGTEISTLSWGFYLAVISCFFNLTCCSVLAMELSHKPPRAPDERFILQTQSSLVEVRETRSASVLSVPTAAGLNPETRPLNKSEVRMRSYSSSVNLSTSYGSPVDTPHPLTGEAEKKFNFDGVSTITA